ncbi:MAG: toprim domain-containing protein, partial [Rickettsiaceae bacterium]|nr:toprim domain-containing protein [Rickettsiaceae bacterium]
DLIALHSAGFKNSVASLGTAVTSGHISKLWRSADEIIICLDADAAGIRACSKVIDNVIPEVSYNKKVSFVVLPSGYDPDDVIRKYGAQKFEKLLSQRLSLSEMIWNIESMNYKVSSSPEDKAELQHKLENYVEQIKNGALKSNYSRFFKDSIWKYFSGRVSNKASIVNVEVPTKMTERELLEYAILSLVVKIPSLLTDHDVHEELSLLDLKGKNISEFRDFLIEKISENMHLDKEKLTIFLKNTRFNSLFMILSDPNAVFLDISKLVETCKPRAFWALLMKRYHLFITKNEYQSLAFCADEDSFAKLQLYRLEILKMQQEIEQLNEALIQNDEPKSRN